MNTQLEKLFQEYNISPQDRYDFLHIYALLPSHKKVWVIENFETIVSQLRLLQQDLLEEQELLFGEALDTIETRLSEIGKKRVLSGTKREIDSLKQKI